MIITSIMFLNVTSNVRYICQGPGSFREVSVDHSRILCFLKRTKNVLIVLL